MKAHTYESWIIKQEQMATNETSDDGGEEKEPSATVSEASAEVAAPGCSSDTAIETIELSSSKRKLVDETQDDGLPRESVAEASDSTCDQKKLKTDESTSTSTITISQSEQTNDIKRSPGFDPSLLAKDPDCFECDQTYREPTRKDLIMYLHALSYKFGDLQFKTDMPYWADENFVDES